MPEVGFLRIMQITQQSPAGADSAAASALFIVCGRSNACLVNIRKTKLFTQPCRCRHEFEKRRILFRHGAELITDKLPDAFIFGCCR